MGRLIAYDFGMLSVSYDFIPKSLKKNLLLNKLFLYYVV